MFSVFGGHSVQCYFGIYIKMSLYFSMLKIVLENSPSLVYMMYVYLNTCTTYAHTPHTHTHTHTYTHTHVCMYVYVHICTIYLHFVVNIHSTYTSSIQSSTACKCDEDGSVSQNCDPYGGQCPCKEFRTGQRCDECEPGRGGPDCSVGENMCIVSHCISSYKTDIMCRIHCQMVNIRILCTL